MTQRPAKTARKIRKPTGRTPAWALKLGSAVFALAVFGGSFDYAANHLSITNAPLQLSVVASSEDTSTSTDTAMTASATSRPTVTLSSTVSTTTRTAVTKTASS